jgi:hypothetical protein
MLDSLQGKPGGRKEIYFNKGAIGGLCEFLFDSH